MARSPLFRGALAGVALAALLLPTAPVSAARFVTDDTNAGISQPVSGDAFVAGATATIRARVSGELFAAGNAVTVHESPGRSIFAAGSSVEVNGAGYNAFLAGSTVIIRGVYGNDVYAAGETVIVEEGTAIAGDLYVGGTKVELAGTIAGSVKAAADTFTSKAAIGGNLEGEIKNLSFTGGSVAGNVRYGSKNDATGLGNVTVGGTVERTEPKYDDSSWRGWGAAGALFTFLGMLLVGFLLTMFFPSWSKDTAERLPKRWAPLGLLGFAGLVVTPIALVVLGAVGVVLPPVFFLVGALLFGYLLLLMLALYYAFLFLGERIATWTKYRVQGRQLFWYFAIGLAVMTIVGWVPVLGGVAGFLFFIGFFLPAFGAQLEKVAAIKR